MITQSAYDACKGLIANPQREMLRCVLRDLNAVQDTGKLPDRSELAYRARKERHQILGYLVLDQEADKLTALFHGSPSHLLEPERRLLLQMHAELVALNQECVATVTARFPHTRIALDPYSEYIHPIGTTTAETPFLTRPSVERIVDAFRSHPAVQILASGILSSFSATSDVDLFQNVRALRTMIGKAGLGNAPSQLERYAFVLPREDPRRVFLKASASLLAVRASLHNLNQMLFQAIESDKPPVLDADNIIHVGDAHAIISGPSARVTYQPDEASSYLAPGDLVLLKEIPNGLRVSGLSQVEETHFEHSQEYGATNRVGIKILNPWLSPYGNLETLL